MFTTRKVLAGAVSGAVCLTMLAAGAVAIEAPKAASDIKVDGILDEAHWAAAEWTSIAVQRDGKEVTNDAKFAVTWDDDNVYVAYKIIDGTVCTENLNEGRWNNDSIELFFDPSPVSIDAYTESSIHYFYQIGDKTSNMTGSVPFWTDITELHPDVKAEGVITDTGYEIEVIVPFKDFGVTAPSVGQTFLFDTSNNDDDLPDSNADSDRLEINLGKDFDSSKPNTWASITLGKELKLPEAPKPTEPSSSASTFDLTAIALAASALSATAFAVSKKSR